MFNLLGQTKVTAYGLGSLTVPGNIPPSYLNYTPVPLKTVNTDPLGAFNPAFNTYFTAPNNTTHLTIDARMDVSQQTTAGALIGEFHLHVFRNGAPTNVPPYDQFLHDFKPFIPNISPWFNAGRGTAALTMHAFCDEIPILSANETWGLFVVQSTGQPATSPMGFSVCFSVNWLQLSNSLMVPVS